MWRNGDADRGRLEALAVNQVAEWRVMWQNWSSGGRIEPLLTRFRVALRKNRESCAILGALAAELSLWRKDYGSPCGRMASRVGADLELWRRPKLHTGKPCGRIGTLAADLNLCEINSGSLCGRLASHVADLELSRRK